MDSPSIYGIQLQHKHIKGMRAALCLLINLSASINSNGINSSYSINLSGGINSSGDINPPGIDRIQSDKYTDLTSNQMQYNLQPMKRVKTEISPNIDEKQLEAANIISFLKNLPQRFDQARYNLNSIFALAASIDIRDLMTHPQVSPSPDSAKWA